MGNTQKIKRSPILELKLQEIYKMIGLFPVVKSGTVLINGAESLFYYSLSKCGAYTELPSHFTLEEIHGIFYVINAAFEDAISIGLREALRLTRQHIAIKGEEGNETDDLKELAKAFKDILNEIQSIGIDAPFIDPVVFPHNNPNITEKTPFKDMNFLYLDTSICGNNQDLDLSPENLINTLDSPEPEYTR